VNEERVVGAVVAFAVIGAVVFAGIWRKRKTVVLPKKK